MLTVGLTGGIGSGKSAVSDAFARRGVAVIDTDLLAREVVEPGQPALDEIAAEFGADVLDPGGRLDRAALRRAVFAEPARRRRLEAILHPRIRQAMEERLRALEAAGADYAIVVVPLLVETGMTALMDRVLVVDVPEAEQIRRVMARDGVDEPQARRVLAAQADRDRRLAAADDVIPNTGTLADLEPKVAELDRRYRALAARP